MKCAEPSQKYRVHPARVLAPRGDVNRTARLTGRGDVRRCALAYRRVDARVGRIHAHELRAAEVRIEEIAAEVEVRVGRLEDLGHHHAVRQALGDLRDLGLVIGAERADASAPWAAFGRNRQSPS